MLNELRDELPGEVEIKRLIIKDTSVVGLKQSIASMPNNDDCSGMKLAALARSIVDWHIGYNYPRFFRCLHVQEVGMGYCLHQAG